MPKELSLEDEWQDLWRAFYDNRAQRDAINVELVEVKTRLRSAGLPYRQPAAPRPVKG